MRHYTEFYIFNHIVVIYGIASSKLVITINSNLLLLTVTNPAFFVIVYRPTASRFKMSRNSARTPHVEPYPLLINSPCSNTIILRINTVPYVLLKFLWNSIVCFACLVSNMVPYSVALFLPESWMIPPIKLFHFFWASIRCIWKPTICS